jgi:TRAP-type mannitol/chloroaromatic compound transport system permease small subunit
MSAIHRARSPGGAAGAQLGLRPRDAVRPLARHADPLDRVPGSGAVLAADVLTVFVSVIFRYFLHDPVDWAEEVARALMIVLVFFGAATVLARSQHVGVDLFRLCCRRPGSR